MSGTTAHMTGFFGKLPGQTGFAGAFLPADFTERWDRWWAMATAEAETAMRLPVSALRFDRPAWRFRAAAGIFAPAEVSGVWRLSRDLRGAPYPLVIAAIGARVPSDAAWFEAADSLIQSASDGDVDAAGIITELARLPATGATAEGGADPGDIPLAAGAAASSGDAVVMWRDDWEVHELAFPTARAFATYGLPGAV